MPRRGLPARRCETASRPLSFSYTLVSLARWAICLSTYSIPSRIVELLRPSRPGRASLWRAKAVDRVGSAAGIQNGYAHCDEKVTAMRGCWCCGRRRGWPAIRRPKAAIRSERPHTLRMRRSESVVASLYAAASSSGGPQAAQAPHRLRNKRLPRRPRNQKTS